MKKRVLYITNVPSPYRVDFFNEFGKTCELTVLFEGRTTEAAQFFDASGRIKRFRPVVLTDGAMRANRIDFRIFRHLKRNEYDWIIATNYGFLTELAAILFLRMRRIPYWLELDGAILHPGESPVKRWLKKTVIGGAQGILTTGRATDRVMLHYGANRERLHLYPFSSFHDSYVRKDPVPQAEKALLRQELGFLQSHMVLAVGQFIPRKGFDVLLDAVAQMGEDAAICIVGGAPTDAYLSQMEALGLHNVFFRPFMPSDELRRYYLAADVFVLPTREDIWGLVINEAMACALPVITTDCCVAGTELIKDGMNGYLVKAEDAAALAARIDAVLSDRGTREKMAAACLDTITGYTIERMAEAHMRILERA